MWGFPIELFSWMSPTDWGASLFFLLVWCGYTWYADHGPGRPHSISTAVSRRRMAWLTQASRRDVRIVDTSILGNLLTGVGFFASTTIFVLGGLMAMLGIAEQGSDALSRLPFSTPVSPIAWELKVLLLLLIFVYAFFKFTWAFRLANYCSILVGSLPLAAHSETEEAKDTARRAGEMSILSGFHFNRGLRAYFFALAASCWFIGPGMMVLTCSGVAFTLYRREFRSQAFLALTRP